MSDPKIKLLGDRILLELEPESDKISGLDDVTLYKPGGESGKDSHVFRIGKVKGLGPGTWVEKKKPKKSYQRPIDLKIGSRVLFVKFVATHTKTSQSIQGIVGDDHAIINEQDVLFEVTQDFDIGSVRQ